MSRTPNGRMRRKSVREAFTEQSPYHRNGKRKSYTHSYDDTDIAYRSAPEYLKQLMNTSTNSARSLTRTHSATDMTPRNLGNPKYKAQEDYYDEVQLLKKELKSFKDDNSNLRARIRRLEEDNARKSKEIDGLYDTNKDGDLRRTLAGSSTPTNSVVMNLKQRLFKLESQLKQKETTIEEMKNDPRWTKGTELEIQNRALFNEIEKQKIERLNFIQHDYMAAIDEEKKNAVRKLEGEKRELKIENENLKKKLSDRSEQLSARQRDENFERKIHDLKHSCRAYENEIEQMKDDLKQMRRDRDKFRDKFETIKEELEEIKHQRNQYRHKLDRTHEFDEGRYHTGRSSPGFKRNDERHTTRSSSEEHWKKDFRPTSPIRRSNEHINSRSPLISKKSSQNLRPKIWTSDDEYRVEKFRRKHAAVVIQRGWRKHRKSHRYSFRNKTKQDSFEKRNLKPGGMASPRSSQQKLGSKIDNFGSGTIRNHESALKTVQAALRGYINRSGLDKTSHPQRSQHNISDDEDTISTPSRKYESERKRENYMNYSKSNFRDNNDKTGSNNRDLTSKLHRTPSPPTDSYRTSSPHVGSKQNLYNDQYKLGSGSRLPINDREPHRTSSPVADNHRPSSPHVGSKQNLYNDQYKLGSGSRLPINDREPHRTSSPATDNHRPLSPHIGSKQKLYNDQYKLGSGSRLPINDREPHRTSPSMDNYHPASPRDTGSKQSSLNDKNKYGSTNRFDHDLSIKSHQNDISLRKSPLNSKQSLKNLPHDDDDDILGF